MAARRTKHDAPRHETFLVRNQSERRAPVLAVAVHSTESQDIPGSTDDLAAIRRWFNNPLSQASSHVGIDGQGNTEVWVRSNRKAWTVGAANSWTCNIEFVARASQAARDWEDAQIRAGARWLAYWATKYDLPIQQANCRNINGLCVCTKKGVLRHSDVTAAGFGTHTDPGRAFPWDEFLRYGRWYRKNGWTR